MADSRQESRPQGRGFRVGAWEVDPQRGYVSRDGERTHLEPKVMEVLSQLADRPGDLATHEALLAAVWPDTKVVPAVLTRAISILRRAFRDDSRRPQFIETIPKRGYVLIAAVTRPTGADARARSVAVLPLQNLAGSLHDDYLAEGITELLISSLSRVRSLRVISRTSVARFRDRKLRVPEIARELGVDLLVEGSLLRLADELVVVVQLIDAPRDAHLWSRELRRRERDILSLQAELAREIAMAIGTDLTPGELRRLSSARPISPRAHDLYLRGLYAFSKRSPDGLRAAVDSFEQAIAADPDAAPAYASLANTYIVLGLYGAIDARAALDKAGALARRALELDEDLGEAHCALGGVRLFGAWDFAGAERASRRCLAHSPGYSIARLALADVLSATGRHDEALSEIAQAVRDSPFDVGLVMNLGDHLLHARRLDEAIERLQQAVAMEPRLPRPLLRLARALALAGNPTGARELVVRAKALAPPYAVAATEALVLAVGRSWGEAQALLLAVAKEPQVIRAAPLEVAGAYAAMGDSSRAFQSLRLGFRQRAWPLIFLGVDPALDPLRDRPEFAGYLRRLGVR
jgi:TolB-like protein/Tfp pilus assembly protein PilF